MGPDTDRDKKQCAIVTKRNVALDNTMQQHSTETM